MDENGSFGVRESGSEKIRQKEWMRREVPFGFLGFFDKDKERDWCEMIQLKRHGYRVQCTAPE